MEFGFNNDWTYGRDYRVRLKDRSDFTAFYHTFHLRSYASLEILEGESVLDAGAYIGVWTILAARLVGRTGTVVAVEPDPMNHRNLVENLRLNGVSNVHAVRKALWSTGGRRVKLRGRGDDVWVSNAGTQEADTDTVDSLAQAHGGRFDRIKMSISGAEGEALKASASSLAHCRQIVLEVYGASNLAFSQALLRERGFKVHYAPFESIFSASAEAVRHPFLTMYAELHNRFRTARRVLDHLINRPRRGSEGAAEFWLLNAHR